MTSNRRIVGRPWAIRASELESMLRAQPVALSAATLASEEHQARPARARLATMGDPRRRASIAVLPLFGALRHRVHDFAPLGGTALESFGKQFRAAAGNPAVAAIVLQIDSPGGDVAGVAELAREIRMARQPHRPIVAMVEPLAASAAYWIGSAADELVVTPSALVGSIGVLAAHEEVSGALAKQGVKVSLIGAGEGKTDGNPFEPLSDRARADLQSKVDAVYGRFVDDVMRNRRVTSSRVRHEWQARVLLAEEAVAVGMADRVATLDQTLERLARVA